MTSKAETLAREKKWALPAGIVAVAGVAMYFIGQFVGSSGLGSPEGSAEILAAVSEHKSNVMLGAAIQGIGIAALSIPLAFLFLAALARSERMRRAFILVAIVGPVFVGMGTIVSALTLTSVSDDWKGDATAGVTKCFEDSASSENEATGTSGETGSTGASGAEGSGADADATGTEPSGSATSTALTEEQKDDCRDEAADDLRNDSSTSGLALGLLGSGAIGFLIGLFYTALNSMRVGLLSRFWGSLGMAVGVILILPTLQIIAFAWFIYLGLLLAGWMPGGRPPAWAAGEAIPWPMPGETQPDDDDVIDGTAEEVEPSADELEPGEAGDFPDDDGPQGERRKRKKRN
ncbi:MAG: hypothetical protein KDB52_00125 [Solirubrobacterales bacterium]|nr:hypothetical protein [Solirubrobacterales bacterium]